MRTRFPVRAIAEAGVAAALAVVLSFVKVYQMPQGGSVTLGSMIPVLLVALRWGPSVGIAAGVVDGLLQYLVEPVFVHPVQWLLDYPVAFGLLGLAGYARRWPWVGSALGIAGRFVAHLLSGVVFFAQYAPAGQNVWVYSAIYNGSYLVPELVVSAILLSLLFLHPAVRELKHQA